MRDNKKGPPISGPFFYLTKRGLLVTVLVLESERIRLANAVKHGVDRNCDSPVVQHGLFTRATLEPASHFGGRLCPARSPRLFVRGGIRTIHVHSASTGSVSLAILTVPQNRSFEPRQKLQSGTGTVQIV